MQEYTMFVIGTMTPTTGKHMENPPMNEPTRWTVTLEQDPESDDLMMPLPQDLLDLLGCQEGDVLIWAQLENGAWSLSKKPTDDPAKALVDPV
jgi:hypothetical protein